MTPCSPHSYWYIDHRRPLRQRRSCGRTLGYELSTPSEPTQQPSPQSAEPDMTPHEMMDVNIRDVMRRIGTDSTFHSHTEPRADRDCERILDIRLGALEVRTDIGQDHGWK